MAGKTNDNADTINDDDLEPVADETADRQQTAELMETVIRVIGDPQVLLLDEPTTGLDPALRRDFYGFLDTLRAGGATILLSSHALSELEGRADRVIIMGGGVKIADGTLDELRAIARLPTRIRVRVAKDSVIKGGERRLNGREGWRAVNGRTMEIDVGPEDKVAQLRAAVATEIADVDVTPPTLDALYAHFQDTQREGAS